MKIASARLPQKQGGWGARLWSWEEGEKDLPPAVSLVGLGPSGHPDEGTQVYMSVSSTLRGHNFLGFLFLSM